MASAQRSGKNIEETIRSAQAGDGPSFAILYETYAPRMRGFALARGSDDADALANDVMLRVFQNLDTFVGDEPAFVRWMFTIARNRLIDHHRRTTRRPIIADAEVPARIVPSAEESALESLSMAEVGARLDALTIDQREVIALRMVEDLSLADVAEIVDKPVTAVKALQRRGLRRLQQEILAEEVS